LSLSERQPTNPNFLSPLGFRFTLRKLPNFDWFVQSCNLPGFNLGDTNQIKNPFSTLITAGDHMTWEPLQMSFKVDEDMQSWREIFDWITALGRPEDDVAISQLLRAKPGEANTEMSDASLVIMNNSGVPNLKMDFYDVIPSGLGGLQFSTTQTDVLYMTCTARFRYRSYRYTKL